MTPDREVGATLSGRNHGNSDLAGILICWNHGTAGARIPDAQKFPGFLIGGNVHRSGMVLVMALVVSGLLMACNLLQPPPDLQWDESAETVVVRTQVSGGLIPQAAAMNELPMGLVFGDGRIVWTTFDDSSNRQVWQGQLSREQMAALLQEFADKGFFRMDSFYQPDGQVYDAGTTSLYVNLLSGETGVSEYYEGAPRAFHQLVTLVSSGAGAEGTPYIPQQGFLTAVPLGTAPEPSLPVWDAEVLGLDLGQASGGMWVEGPALLRAWELVNEQYWGPRVQQGEQVYELWLSLPELTGREPTPP